mmetsp:Transcript_22517/g.64344  ORF Transcript_22517/g.64344 Transcript_22517/m.64344 type:complete len:92 (+) Transcript_22517:990-1265(+)
MDMDAMQPQENDIAHTYKPPTHAHTPHTSPTHVTAKPQKGGKEPPPPLHPPLPPSPATQAHSRASGNQSVGIHTGEAAESVSQSVSEYACV